MIMVSRPNEQSINRQKMGISLMLPAIKASGKIKIADTMPNWITQMFLTGFIKGPTNKKARIKCAKANQSVP